MAHGGSTFPTNIHTKIPKKNERAARAGCMLRKRHEKRERRTREADHERVKWEGEALRGEHEGVLRRGGESKGSSLRL